MLDMSFQGLAIDEYVIKEDKDKYLEIWFQYFVHEALEGGWYIAKVKRHDQKLIVALMGVKSCLGDVFFFHPNLMLSQAKIQFGEVLGSMKLI
jgi:hypothetical protein